MQHRIFVAQRLTHDLQEYGRKDNVNFNYLVKYPAMVLWQFHLIGRVDDTTNFGIRNPKGHKKFDFSMKTTVQWSKNVRNEDRYPDQILLGSDNR